ncbi:MAG: DDE-type integrase/transposase/recombinase [Clostridia bacterium]|nr:DDE-type integrase/transposase/recombinase [Clostridia bacterium]
MSNILKENIAVERIQLITPLLEPQLDQAKRVFLRKQLAQKSGLSERTLRRYESAYQKEGFTGLQPKTKSPTRSNALPKKLVDEAIMLRREVPTRSVSQIIRILEWEGKASPDQIKRSTLQEHLTKAGYSAVTMRSYQSQGLAARRFQARNRNNLWHSDIKFGPFLPAGKNGKVIQMYLVTFMDDATRYVLHAAFYDNLEQIIVKDAFMEAITHHGVPKAVYFDNGKQYRNGLIKRACAKLDIRLLFARPFGPEGTGKIEKFNRNIDHFLQEIRLDKPQTLEDLNRKLQVWLNICYQQKPHSALKENQTPDQCYRNDATPLHYTDSSTLAEAFKQEVIRKVDKVGCISLHSRKYEVGTGLIGQRVTIVYDLSDLREIRVEAEFHSPFIAKELVIGPKAGKRPDLPERLLPVEPDHSRLLEACQQQNHQKAEKVRQAISYTDLTKGGNRHV